MNQVPEHPITMLIMNMNITAHEPELKRRPLVFYANQVGISIVGSLIMIISSHQPM
jgi:hypothetical protein